MKRTAFLAALLTLASPSVSFAGQAAITVRDAVGLAAALRSLDGHPAIVKQDGKDVTVQVPYEFGSGSLRLRIAGDLSVLGAVEQALERARRGVVGEILKARGGEEIKPGSPAYEDFTKQMEQVLDQPAAGTDALARIKGSELKLDRNEIPGTTLAALRPILDQDQ